MNQLSKDYLRYTFSIMLPCWGLCILFSANGVSINDSSLLYIPYLFGGWSPTVASFLALKKHREITGLRDWLKKIFDVRHNLFSYLTVIVFAVLFILPQCLIAGCESGAPFFAIIFMLPVMLFGGGLEEAGWRCILQPELEKKYKFVISTALVGVIWWLWHLPLFYIQGVSQYGHDYLAFGIDVFGLSFALAGIRKATGSVWLCVLFHCVVNSLSGMYQIRHNILGNMAATALLILGSLLLLKLSERKKLFR